MKAYSFLSLNRYRCFAFIIDLLVLLSLGYGLLFLFFDSFHLLGIWTKFIGFFISLIYFSLLDSNFFKGQTLGKKLLAIKVVNNKGEYIGIIKSIFRSLITCMILNFRNTFFCYHFF